MRKTKRETGRREGEARWMAMSEGEGTGTSTSVRSELSVSVEERVRGERMSRESTLAFRSALGGVVRVARVRAADYGPSPGAGRGAASPARVTLRLREGIEPVRRKRREHPCARLPCGAVPDVVHELLATEVALDKLAARRISADEAGQLSRNRHVTVRNPRAGSEPGKRRLMIGRTDGGRVLTLVIERTVEPTTWLIVTGWSSTDTERKILDG